MGGLFAKQATHVGSRVVRTKKDLQLIDEAESRLADLKAEQQPSRITERDLEAERSLRDPNFEASMLNLAAGITVFSANTTAGKTQQDIQGSFANRHLLLERRGAAGAGAGAEGVNGPGADDVLVARNPVGPVVGDIAQSTATLASRYRQRALARARLTSTSFANIEVGPKDLLRLLEQPSESQEVQPGPTAFDFLSEHDRSLINKYYRTWEIHTAVGRKGRLVSFATWPTEKTPTSTTTTQ